jgi:hypothetical protein
MRAILLVSLALGLVSLPQVARADGVLLSQATPVQREQAGSRFRRGKELMASGHYDEAAAEFRASHEIVASPNTRLELARCLRLKGRLVAAYAEFGRTMVEAKESISEDQRYQRAYNASADERAQLEPKLGFVILTIDNPSEGTRVIVGGEEIRRAAWAEPAPVEAGAAEVRVETPGHLPVTRKVSLAPGGKAELRVDAQSGETPSTGESHTAPATEPTPEAEHPPLPLWPSYVGYGVAAVSIGVALGVGFGSVSSARSNANSTGHNIQAAGGMCPSTDPTIAASCEQYKNDLNLIDTDKAVAYALGITGGVIAAASTAYLLIVLKPWAHNEPAPSAAPVAVTPAPVLGPRVAGLVLNGTF